MMDNVLEVRVIINGKQIDTKIDKKMMEVSIKKGSDEFQADLQRAAYISNELHPCVLELVMHGNIV